MVKLIVTLTLVNLLVMVGPVFSVDVCDVGLDMLDQISTANRPDAEDLFDHEIRQLKVTGSGTIEAYGSERLAEGIYVRCPGGRVMVHLAGYRSISGKNLQEGQVIGFSGKSYGWTEQSYTMEKYIGERKVSYILFLLNNSLIE
ncbi:MAG: hypothetical protein HQK59_09855 [Deltaproteobacteria bacterium]|nr:hypothetical protein [Deltaproteobacteria bacterium]